MTFFSWTEIVKNICKYAITNLVSHEEHTAVTMDEVLWVCVLFFWEKKKCFQNITIP